ncbi:MAG: hypothetical protein ACRDPQ_21415 [Nocardioidaceae bacterium]
MRPERFLGSDPAPGDLGSVDRVAGALRTVLLGLAESRQRIEAIVGPHSMWQGPMARPIVTALTNLAARLRAIDNAAVDFAQAVEIWRAGLVARQERRAELTEMVSQLAGRPDAEEQRHRIQTDVQRLATEHTTDGAVLIRAADALAEVLIDVDEDGDLAADLDRGVAAVTVAVEEWIAESAAELLATAESLSDTAGLTTVVSQILGVVGDESPDESDSVRRLASVSAGAHRLRLALRRSWASLAPEQLPEATFAAPRSSSRPAISDRLRGDQTDPDAGGEAR